MNGLLVLYNTFSNISAISWRPVLAIKNGQSRETGNIDTKDKETKTSRAKNTKRI